MLSGEVYIAGEVIDWTWTQSRNRNVKLQLLDVAKHYQLPDVDFVLLTGDWPPEDRSGQSLGCPLQGPVFMQVCDACRLILHLGHVAFNQQNVDSGIPHFLRAWVSPVMLEDIPFDNRVPSSVSSCLGYWARIYVMSCLVSYITSTGMQMFSDITGMAMHMFSCIISMVMYR